MAEQRIRKIKLSNDQVFSIYDAGALRLIDDVLYTDNEAVDNVILQGHLSIKEIDNVPIAQSNMTVLSVNSDGTIIKQNIKQVLRDLGLVTANVENEILSLDTISI